MVVCCVILQQISLYTVPYIGFNVYTLLLLSPHKRVIISTQRIWPPLVFHTLKNTEMWVKIKDLMSIKLEKIDSVHRNTITPKRAG